MNDIQGLILAALVGAIPPSIAAIWYILKSSSDARNTVVKDTATTRNQVSVDTARANNAQQMTAMDAVAAGFSNLLVILKDSVDNVAKANEIASKERAETALIQREMMGHINGVLSTLKITNEKQQAMNLSLDDMERTVESARAEIKEARTATEGVKTEVKEAVEGVKTDVEGVLVIQFKPVVEAIQLVTKQIDGLSGVIQSKDEETILRMGLVQSAIGALETTLLRILEPIAIAYIGVAEVKNGKTEHPTPPPIIEETKDQAL